jgi:parvulin-like peptidyl-prolyl isomerase
LKQNLIKYLLFKKYFLKELRLIKVKSGEITRRIKATEKEIDQVHKELSHETEPPEESFLILEEEVCVLLI